MKYELCVVNEIKLNPVRWNWLDTVVYFIVLFNCLLTELPQNQLNVIISIQLTIKHKHLAAVQNTTFIKQQTA